MEVLSQNTVQDIINESLKKSISYQEYRALVSDLVAKEATTGTEQTGTGYMKVATGTTAERPGTPVAGMIRFNTTTSTFEGYDGTAWVDLH